MGLEERSGRGRGAAKGGRDGWMVTWLAAGRLGRGLVTGCGRWAEEGRGGWRVVAGGGSAAAIRQFASDLLGS